MLINNEFVIEQYNGQLPMTLLTPPSGMDSATTSQYNTFIKNISTIYSSQNNDGSVAVFFKNSNGVASSASTLTQLNPDQKYYFISKSSSVFPYAIPAIGGSNAPSCSELQSCCPYISFNSDQIKLSGSAQSSNIYTTIVATASGLNPGKTYSYEYEPVMANWPSKISPMSGTFIPMSHSDTITSIFHFCPRTSNCSGYLPYEYDDDPNSDFVQNNIFSTLKIKLYPGAESDCPLMSDITTIFCNQCLPKSTPTPTPTPTIIPVYDTVLTISSSTTTSGENGAGVNFKGSINDQLQFDSNNTPDAPAIMRIILNNVQVAQVTFPYNTYAGRPFTYIKNNLRYSGIFALGDVVLV